MSLVTKCLLTKFFVRYCRKAKHAIVEKSVSRETVSLVVLGLSQLEEKAFNEVF